MPDLAKVIFSYRDATGEVSTTGLCLPEVTDDGLNYPNVATARDTLASLFGAITLGQLAKLQVQASVGSQSADLPASSWAQREMKIKFSLGAADGHRSSFELPMPDLDTITPGTNDFFDLTQAGLAALVTELESGNYRDSVTGSPIASVISAELVGRRN